MNHLKIKKLSDEEMKVLIEKHNKGGAFAKQISAEQSCWSSGIEIIKTCGHMSIPKYDVEFEVVVDEKIKKLQNYYPSLEWLAYLEGEVDHENKHVLVTDIVIPDSQEVTSVNVYNVEYGWSDGRKIIGVIHSHHSMGAFFSGTDDAYINQNHDVSIVVSTSDQSPIKGQVRMKTRCGSYILAEDLNFSVKHKKVLDEEAFEKEFTSKINSYRPRNVAVVSGTYNAPSPNHIIRKPLFPSTNQVEVNFYSPEKELELRNVLVQHYSEEEVDDFINTGEAEEEVDFIKEMESKGFQVGTDASLVMTETEWNTDDEPEPEWENDQLKNQMGLHQVSYGTPIRPIVDDILDLTEEDLVKPLN